MSAKAALAAAREAGIVRPDGDTRLATEAIGRLSVLAHETDGHVVIGFLDKESGVTLSLDEARAQGFTYEHGSTAAAAAPAPEVASEPEANADVVAVEEDVAMEVPHELADGRLKLINIDDNFQIELSPLNPSDDLLAMTDTSAIESDRSTEIADQQEMVKELSQRMASTQGVLEKLETKNLVTPEAHLLRNSLKDDMESATCVNGSDIISKVDLNKIQTEVDHSVRTLFSQSCRPSTTSAFQVLE